MIDATKAGTPRPVLAEIGKNSAACAAAFAPAPRPSASSSVAARASVSCSAVRAGPALSILLTATKSAGPSVAPAAVRERLSTIRSPGPMAALASISATSTSTPSSAVSADSLRRCPSCVFGRWMPGVSTNTTWASSVVSTPRIWWRVVLGRDEVIVTFSPTIVLIRVDFPTFGRPAMVTNPERISETPHAWSSWCRLDRPQWAQGDRFELVRSADHPG